MIDAAWVFWLAFFFTAYTYFGYPLLICLLARIRPRRELASPTGNILPPIDIVIAAYNEAANLPRRIANLLEQDYPADQLSIIIVSDGSSDETAAILHALAARDSRIKPIILEHNQGKAVALNAGLEAAQNPIVVFADARQTFAPDAIQRLVQRFQDPAIGSVSGELVLTEDEDGVAANVGLYWRYEKWIRRCESMFNSMLGATGAIYAIRRDLWQPLPPGTLLDDFLTPMRIVLKGRRAVFEPGAHAFDRASSRGRQEFVRKIRTLAGNFQAVAAEPRLLAPWSNPGTWFQLWSHKLFRLAVPYALIAMFIASICAPGPLYGLLSALQAVFYAGALIGWWCERQRRPLPWRIIALAYTFTALNLAAVAGLFDWLRGNHPSRVWKKAYPAESSAHH